ncbi:hypothetical protein BV22DRAFT_1131756 [Leucogyrophana mollusca]|uniref:Uncharacterized protein n=1 Tax=Leucogyrophana mollusca TaxID=85980 RepID=A0ACB8BB17_9AGAM|nr:hypothetical protein BV22DRAFT_1131756 [Leucogyrophana mollusca]
MEVTSVTHALVARPELMQISSTPHFTLHPPRNWAGTVEKYPSFDGGLLATVTNGGLNNQEFTYQALVYFEIADCCVSPAALKHMVEARSEVSKKENQWELIENFDLMTYVTVAPTASLSVCGRGPLSQEVPTTSRHPPLLLIRAGNSSPATVLPLSNCQILAYCSKAIDDPTSGCSYVFVGQAGHTIVQVPYGCDNSHYARIKSLKVRLHLASRSAHIEDKPASEPVCGLDLGYDFDAIPDDNGPINMQVDASNMSEYWDTVVETPPEGKR